MYTRHKLVRDGNDTKVVKTTRSQIRWRDDDIKELQRVVKNFNAKVARLEKKNPELYNKNTLPAFYDSKHDMITNRISVRQLKELIHTRQDLKREINALKRFTKRGAEEIVDVPGDSYYNLKITKWQRTETNRRLAIINRYRKDRREYLNNLDLTSGGKRLGYKRGDLGMGSTEANSLNKKEAYTYRQTPYELKLKFVSIFKESMFDYHAKQDYNTLENYLVAIERNFGPEGKEIIDGIKEMDLDDFLDVFNSEDAPFEKLYPKDLQQYNAMLSELKTLWLHGDPDTSVDIIKNIKFQERL